jgi:hypothetical protein
MPYGSEWHFATDDTSSVFESARRRGLGVCLYAIRVRAGSTLAVVEYPSDSDEAERLMYPSNGGLKFSAAVLPR